MAGVETVVRERYEESTEPRSKTEKKGERERPVDSIPSETKQRERIWREKEGERGEANAEQEEARQDGREEEPRPVCASASESD